MNIGVPMFEYLMLLPSVSFVSKARGALRGACGPFHLPFEFRHPARSQARTTRSGECQKLNRFFARVMVRRVFETLN